MEFREYQENDALEILKWINNERDFRMWSADRYDIYPIKPDDININYYESKKISNFYPMTLTIDGKIIGHLILRNPNSDKNTIRLGFIIVDNSIRGKGYGKLLILEAIKYAKEVLHAKNINLGVFDSNESAIFCYKACGFEEIDVIKDAYKYQDETWNQVEMVLKK